MHSYTLSVSFEQSLGSWPFVIDRRLININPVVTVPLVTVEPPSQSIIHGTAKRAVLL
ncbi:Uncharacterized protein APZ42_022140 [Daphnia magna]|uniref:Uncharacterized protein n=1 Tax=Daphnia magna TaxID=35525 RepID=A0A164W248_9CRUS|nr:Uncharacterized protein APZ42_022140 [Daphnia magna]